MAKTFDGYDAKLACSEGAFVSICHNNLFLYSLNIWFFKKLFIIYKKVILKEVPILTFRSLYCDFVIEADKEDVTLQKDNEATWN